MDLIALKSLAFFRKVLKNRISFLGGFMGVVFVLFKILNRNIPPLPKDRDLSYIDSSFISQLMKLVSISIPSFTSKEAIYTYTLGSLLLCRTYLSIFLTSLNGKLLKSLITNDKQAFYRRVISK
jgi:ABC transporter transmembrane region 2